MEELKTFTCIFNPTPMLPYWVDKYSNTKESWQRPFENVNKFYFVRVTLLIRNVHYSKFS